MLNGWLTLLSTEDIASIPKAISDYPWLADIYIEMANYMIHPEKVLTMFSEALRIMDRNATHLYIDELQKEREKLQAEVLQQQAKLDDTNQQLDNSNQQLDEQAQTINALRAELDALKHNHN